MNKQETIAVSDLFFLLSKKLPKLAKITVIRDLNFLSKLNFIKRVGKGRSVVYSLSSQLLGDGSLLQV
mgnify:CR=1 FL=1